MSAPGSFASFSSRFRQKWSRGQVEAWLTAMPPCQIGMEACVGAHHLSRRLQALGHDARLMPAKYVRAYSKGQKNDFRDAEAIAEAVRCRDRLRGDDLKVWHHWVAPSPGCQYGLLMPIPIVSAPAAPAPAEGPKLKSET